MDILLIFLFILVFMVFIPLGYHFKAQQLQKELEKLSKQVNALTTHIESGTPGLFVKQEDIEAPLQQMPLPLADRKNTQEADPIAPQAPLPTEEHLSKTTTDTIETQAVANTPSSDKEHKETVAPGKRKVFEQQLAMHWPAWIGGIALALAGLFLVKYSIDNNLISPLGRVILGLLLGSGFLAGARWIRNKPDIANGALIAQSLSGAGIAVLYIAVFAATNLYGLLTGLAGFIGMAAITFNAVLLSLRYGSFIALLGLAGAMLTPELVYEGQIPTAMLFIYLSLIFSGLMIVVRLRHWWWLAILATVCVFLQVFVWLGLHYPVEDTIWVCWFILIIKSLLIFSSYFVYRNKEFPDNTKDYAWIRGTNVTNFLGSSILMAFLVSHAGFATFEYFLFFLLAASSLFLAHRNEKLYGLDALINLLISGILLFAHPLTIENFQSLSWSFILYGLLYIGASYYYLWRSQWPIFWGGLGCTAALGFYLLAWYRLNVIVSIPLLWGLLAFLLTSAAIYTVIKARHHFDEHQNWQKQYLLILLCAIAAAFCALGLTIELDREFLSVAIAIEILAVSAIVYRLHIPGLRYICMALMGVFAIILLPQILLLVQLTAYSLSEAKLALQESIPIVQWPFFQLGIPAALFLGSSYLLKKDKDDKLVHTMELSSVALITIMGYYLTRHLFHVGDVLFVKAGFFERGVITNILFLFGLLCLYFGRHFTRPAFGWSGIFLCAIALFRIIYFDLILYNPLYQSQTITGWFVFNSLILPFGLPILWIWLAGRELKYIQNNIWGWETYIRSFMLPLSFVLVTLNVRYFFHGTYLNGAEISNLEIYSYSVAWLLLGIALLLMSIFILQGDKVTRYASLGIIILTIGKVFLFDASELQGLFRVFSFLGLGFALLGISWFYSRFIFRKESHE